MPPTPEIPFDVSYVFPDGLRAEPVDHASMRAAIDWLESAAEELGGRERIRLLGLAGAHAGIVRDLERARRLLSAALVDAVAIGDDRLTAVNEIRLADVVALGGAPGTAVAMLEGLLAAGVAQDLEDFVHQHLGKAYLEAGNRRAALASFQRALELREGKGDEELLASTRAALDAATSEGGGSVR
jgi:tetratricopeptide (TPR) repeat protein